VIMSENEQQESLIGILVGTGCQGSAVSDIYLRTMLALQLTCTNGSALFGVLTVGTMEGRRYGARNIITAQFLDNEAFSHLLLVDANIGFQPELVVRMLGFDRDVICGAYPSSHIDWDKARARAAEGDIDLSTAALRYDVRYGNPERIEATLGFAQVESAPLGMVLIKRSALIKLRDAYPDRQILVPEGAEIPKTDNLYLLFERSVDPMTRQILDEDQTFCQRWRDLGGEIWVDLLGKVDQVAQYYFQGDVSKQFAAIDQA
jgi:hypothetical protein